MNNLEICKENECKTCPIKDECDGLEAFRNIKKNETT